MLHTLMNHRKLHTQVNERVVSIPVQCGCDSYFLRSATSHTEGAERHCFEWEIWHLPRQKHEVKPRVLLCAYLNTMKLINLAGSDGHTNSSFLNPMLSYSL